MADDHRIQIHPDINTVLDIQPAAPGCLRVQARQTHGRDADAIHVETIITRAQALRLAAWLLQWLEPLTPLPAGEFVWRDEPSEGGAFVWPDEPGAVVTITKEPHDV